MVDVIQEIANSDLSTRFTTDRLSDEATEVTGLLNDSLSSIERSIVKGDQKMAINVKDQMVEIIKSIDETNTLMLAISIATKEQSTDIANIDTINQQNTKLVDRLASNTHNLNQKVNFLIGTNNIFHLQDNSAGPSHPLHVKTTSMAQQDAKGLSPALALAVQKRQITYEQVFDHAYKPIPNTETTKFSSQLDSLTGQIFPATQEAILDSNPLSLLTAATDNNGFIPTHNLRFTKPLTDDLNLDSAGNRTKQIFNDRIGLIAGSNTTQNYTRYRFTLERHANSCL